MKKVLLIIILLIFPFMVYAEELPREGVTYFLEYPDGSEVITENYDEAVNVSEELIAEATTNSNGEIVLNGWSNEGALKIVQEVPNGYSTQAREIVVDLSNNDNVVFTNYRGLINPNTGRSAILFIGIGVLLLILFLYLVRKTKMQSFTAVLIITLLVIGSNLVKAEGENFVIKVKDDSGKGLSGVKVKIYAAPKVEASPAIKFNANGGEFADGTNLMYVRIPEGCTREQFGDLYLSEGNFIDFNTSNVTREGYNYVNFTFYDLPEGTILKNGDEYLINWEESNDSHVITIEGNGALINIGGKKLTRIKKYMRKNIGTYQFNKEGSTFVGYDNNPGCVNYLYGVLANKNINYDNDVYYQCWFENPDGIYVYGNNEDLLSNTYYFNGNKDYCFSDSTKLSENSLFIGTTNCSHLGIDSSRKIQLFIMDDLNSVKFSGLISEYGQYNCWDNPSGPGQCGILCYYNYYPISRIKIVYQGNTILDLSEGTLAFEGEDSALRYYPSSQNDKNILNNYFDGYIDRCLPDVASGDDGK